MALVDVIAASLPDKQPVAAVLAEEYWCPQREDWLFHEYVCHGVTVVREIDLSNIGLPASGKAHMNFTSDRETARTMANMP